MYRHNLKILSVGADGLAVAISFANVSGCQEGPMAAFRIFGFSLLLTVAALALGYAHGGLKALFLLVVLAVLEVSLSFDNAIINAAVLKRMSPFWRQMFLTVGILGGYTTFSTFSLDSALLIERGDYTGAAAYIVGSAVLSIVALFAGFWIVRAV